MTQDKPSTTAREKLLRIFFFKGVVRELNKENTVSYHRSLSLYKQAFMLSTITDNFNKRRTCLLEMFIIKRFNPCFL